LRRRGAPQIFPARSIPPSHIIPGDTTMEAADAAELISELKEERAEAVRGRGMTVEALPIDRTLDVLRRYNALNQDRTLPPERP
jgi:hypothetical protein